MKKSILVVVLLGVMILTGSAFAADGNLYVTHEYKIDDSGYKYGVDYYVDSTVNTQIYVWPYISAQDNVTGALVTGTVLLKPHEKHFKIGSFMVRDRSKAWSLTVDAKWQTAN